MITKVNRNSARTAQDAGVSDRVTFEVANASNFSDQQYEMISFFDCLHDMGDPVGACRRANETLAADGSALIVEPMAGNTVEENFNIMVALSQALLHSVAQQTQWR